MRADDESCLHFFTVRALSNAPFCKRNFRQPIYNLQNTNQTCSNKTRKPRSSCKSSGTARNSSPQESGPSKNALFNAPFCGDKVLTEAR